MPSARHANGAGSPSEGTQKGLGVDAGRWCGDHESGAPAERLPRVTVRWKAWVFQAPVPQTPRLEEREF
jgi:hypothetical protein